LTSGSSFLSEVKRIEDLGYDSIWTGEHIFFHVPTLDAAAVMAGWAALTTKITIGCGITLLPLRPPAVSAKSFSTVDVIAGGRTIVGVGVGGEYPKEFEACGVPVSERGARTTEAIEILKKLWTGEEVTHQGRFWQFGPVRLQPPPVQPGGPPIWVSGRSDAAIKRAARLGDAYLPYLFSIDRFRRSARQLADLAEAAGRDPGSVKLGTLLEVCVADTHEQAHQAAADALGRTYQQDFDHLVDRLCALGTPDQVADQIAGFADAGVDHFIFRPHPTADLDWWGQVETIARDVLPKIRQEA
jgi:probable F420-dependent oxidoreductase